MNNIINYKTKYGNINLYKNEIYIGDTFKNDKYWNEDTLILLKKYIDPNKNILEIGAHCGTSTLFYANFLEKGLVYSYEPQKNMFNLLEHNIKINNLNQKVNIYNNGVFCYEGVGIMNNIDLDGRGGLISDCYNENSNMLCNFGGVCLGQYGEEVNLTTVDNMNIDNIGFIQCHAQGSESFIFSKSINLINKNKPFILFQNNKKQNNYLYKKVCSSYPTYFNESQFDIVEYCINMLGYTVINNFNGGLDDLLIPPQNNFDKVIHITYKNKEKLLDIKEQWLKLNPEYKVILYDDNDCKNFLLEYYGKLYCDIFDYIKDGPIKCDFFRCCLIYITGGLYVDADINPLIPLNTFIEDDIELCTCISYNYNKKVSSWAYNPHFILAKKFNDILYTIIHIYVNLYNTKQEYSYWSWSICKFFHNINSNFHYLPNEKNIFINNNKKYQFLTENIIDKDNNVFNFSNFHTKNNNIYIDVFCMYNNICILNNFSNKKQLI